MRGVVDHHSRREEGNSWWELGKGFDRENGAVFYKFIWHCVEGRPCMGTMHKRTRPCLESKSRSRVSKFAHTLSILLSASPLNCGWLNKTMLNNVIASCNAVARHEKLK